MKRSETTEIVDDAKMEAAILHIALACRGDDKFGAVKLNKILFYADFDSYLKRGKSITGQEYFALDEGPAPQRMKRISEKLIAKRAIAIEKIDVGMPNPLHRIHALQPPDYSILESEDVAILDSFIAKFWDKHGGRLSKETHKLFVWKAAYDKGEKTPIKYASVRFDFEKFMGVETPIIPRHLVEHAKQLFRDDPNPLGC